MNRRDFLKWAATSSVFALSPLPGAWAFTNGTENVSSKKLIVILLRGGADGLNVVAPYGDNRYYDLRPRIALSKPGSTNGAIDLDGYFGLNPALAPLMPYWNNKSLAFVHACGSPDPSRSHFDAQDYMESGVPGQKSISTGWMNRLVSQLPSKHSPVQAFSIGPTLPRIFSGPATVATIASSNKPNQVQAMPIDKPIIAKGFEELYGKRTDDLGRAYAEGIAAHKEVNRVLSTPDDAEMAAVQADSMEQIAANRGAPILKRNNPFGKQVSKLFRSDPAVQVAFLDFGGWDTHVNEGTGVGQLANKLSPLGAGLADLIEGLGPLFKDTTIVVMSEFGRTAKENGNAGTDHGHGNVMWLLGGEIPGGHVYGRWAGLNNNELHESRDLPTSTDFRTVVSTILGNQIQLPKQAVANVFPDFQSPGNPFVKA